MKKLNIILHETTIINFPFFWKLLVRYKWFSLIVPLFVFSYASYYYKSQNDIYLRRKFFKYISSESENPSSTIASVLGEQASRLTESEIVGLVGSLDFQQEFTNKLLKDPAFLKMNITPISSKEYLTVEKLIETCGGFELCVQTKARGLIFSFMKIMPDRVVVNKYFIQVSSLSPDTTKYLLNKLSEEVVKTRVSAIRHKIDEQIKLSRGLAESKKSELEKVDLKDLKDRSKSLEASLASITKKIERNNLFRQRLKMELALTETQVSETKKVYKDNIQTDRVLVYQKRKRLEDKIRKYEEDIGAIRSLNDSVSTQDRVILKQLEEELTSSKKKLLSMGMAGRKVSSDVKFISRKEDESNYTEFDFKVKKEQYKKSTKEYEDLFQERIQVNKELSIIEDKLQEIKPSFEYLKLLEQKIIQLTLLNSTVISDLIFENQLSPQKVYKKVARSKVYLFSFALSLSLLMILISLFFLLDDRIYDQYELEESFEDLTIIGNTPDFD